LDHEFLSAGDADSPHVPWSIGFDGANQKVAKDVALILGRQLEVLLDLRWQAVNVILERHYSLGSDQPDL
jgi:hypothetical protein